MAIRIRLLIAFSACLLTAAGIVCGIAFFYVRQTTEDAFHALAVSHLERVEEQMDAFMRPGADLVESLATEDIVRESRGLLNSYLETEKSQPLNVRDFSPHSRLLHREFVRCLRSNVNFARVFLGLSDGGFVQAPDRELLDAGFDPRLSRWYREGVEGGAEVTFTTPYSRPHSYTTCSIIARVSDSEGRFIGFVGVDYNLQQLISRLNTRRVLKTGYLVILDHEGRLMDDGSRPEDIGKTLQDFAGLLRRALENPARGWRGEGPGGGEKYIVAYRLQKLNWTLAVIFDHSEVVAYSYRLLRMVLISVAAVLLFTVPVAFLLARSIVRPMENLVSASKIISSGEHEQSRAAREQLRELMAVEGKGETRELADALSTVIKTLERRVEAARRASRAKSEFLANMSHEIRTPMNAVIGLTHLLLQDELTERQRDFAEKIHSAAGALLGIIDGILDFSKIEAGKMQIERLPFSPGELLEEVCGLFREQSRERKLPFETDIAPELPPSVLGDPLRLRQILINLIGNAFKFTEKGRISVSADIAETTPSSVLLRFVVADTGIGMSEAQAAQVFEAFAQADTSVTRRYGGTGLGLSITSRLVQLMGGDIFVDSKEGEGTAITFTVRFGRDEGAPAAPDDADAPATAAAALAGARVLLVEDNPVNTLIAVELLRNVGIDVSTAGHGGEALTLLEKAVAEGRSPAFDLVLMDLQMPVLDGYETVRRIRAMPEHADLPILAMTAHALEDERERCLTVGMNGHLTKPIDVGALYAALGRFIRKEPVS